MNQRLALGAEIIGYFVVSILMNYCIDIHYVVAFLFGGIMFFGVRLFVLGLFAFRSWLHPKQGQFWKVDGGWGTWR